GGCRRLQPQWAGDRHTERCQRNGGTRDHADTTYDTATAVTNFAASGRVRPTGPAASVATSIARVITSRPRFVFARLTTTIPGIARQTFGKVAVRRANPHFPNPRSTPGIA